MKESTINNKQNNLPFKELLIKFCSSSLLNFKPKDPIKKLIPNTLTFLKKFNNEENTMVSKYFNINMLININPTLFQNPKFIALILEMNNYIKKASDSYDKSKIAIISRIIYDLITNYKIYRNNNNDKKFQKIENEIYIRINEYLKEANGLKLIKKEKLLSTSVEKLYNDIIYLILKKFNFKKHGKEYYEILEKLEFKWILFPQKVEKKIVQIISSKRDNIKRLKIKFSYDLINPEKINFNYILLKYILKKTIYIYHIPFLLVTRRAFFKILKTKLNNLIEKEIDNNLNEKIEYLIKVFTDSEYYSNIYNNFLKMKEIIKYYKAFYYKDKSKDIKYIIENINNKKEKEFYKTFYDNILKDYEIAKKMNKRIPIIKYIFSDNIIEDKNLGNYASSWENIETLLNNKLFTKIKRKNKIKIAEYFTNENNKQLLIDNFNSDVYEFIKEKSFEFLNNKDNKLMDERISNQEILFNENDSRNDNDTNIILESEFLYNSSGNYEGDLTSESSKTLKFFLKFKYNRLIGKHENGCEFIKEYRDYIISGGSDKKVLIYDNSFKKLTEITSKNWINNIFVSKKIKNFCSIILLCTKNEIIVNEFFQDSIPSKGFEEIKIDNCLNFLDAKNEGILLCTNSGIFKFRYLFSRMFSMKQDNISNKAYKGMIMINENEVAFTSNQIIPNGKDRLIFYYIKENLFHNKIKGYSFLNSSNGLAVINREKENNCIILLCACKKYIHEQKNGILIVLNDKKRKKLYNFYETDDFEVYCFCPIIIKENNFIFNDEKNILHKTNYFFVGGFDTKAQKGIVKLFEFDNGDNLLSIKLINYCEIENFSEFTSAITCIIQSNNTENILISCIDGSVHLLKFDFSIFVSNSMVKKIEIQA